VHDCVFLCTHARPFCNIHCDRRLTALHCHDLYYTHVLYTNCYNNSAHQRPSRRHCSFVLSPTVLRHTAQRVQTSHYLWHLMSLRELCLTLGKTYCCYFYHSYFSYSYFSNSYFSYSYFWCFLMHQRWLHKGSVHGSFQLLCYNYCAL
jgi:hypothetical protein